MRSLALVTFIALSGLTAAHAEIAPQYYAQDQKGAPEAITVVIESVDVSTCWFNACDGRDVKVTAKVTAVERSASGVSVGQVITIEYRNVNMKGRSGPRPIRVLEKGEAVPAFLTKDGAIFRPAARGASFEPQITL